MVCRMRRYGVDSRHNSYWDSYLYTVTCIITFQFHKLWRRLRKMNFVFFLSFGVDLHSIVAEADGQSSNMNIWTQNTEHETWNNASNGNWSIKFCYQWNTRKKKNESNAAVNITRSDWLSSIQHGPGQSSFDSLLHIMFLI